MDRNELIRNLLPFKQACAKSGKPLVDLCLEELIPGDSTSYILQVKSAWIDALACSDALDFLIDTLFVTTTEDTRKHIFYIQLKNNADVLRCHAENKLAEKAL